MLPPTGNDEDHFSAKKAVRTFSWKAYADDPDNDLVKSLVVAEASTEKEQQRELTSKEQWMQIFDSAASRAFCGSQDEIILAHPTSELSQAYKRFLKCLPKNHEARIEDGPPRLEVVVDALTFAEATWKNNREKTKAGRMRGLFSKVAVNLNKYKELFAIVPSSNTYVSLVAGSVSAIIKATVNHEKIAESVSNAVDDLSEDIAYWKELLEINERCIRTEHYVSRLYAVVFIFLATIMTKWSSKSSAARLFRSFDSEFFKNEIEDKKAKIRDLEYKLRRQSDLVMQRNTNSIISKADMAQLLADSQARFELQLMMKIKQQQLILGQTIKGALEDQFRNQQEEQRELALRLESSINDQINSRIAATTLETSETLGRYYTNVQIRLNALHQLRSYVAQQRILTLIERSEYLNVHIEIFNRIQQWNAARTLQTLWIQGPFQVPQPSRYTQLSAYVITTAQKADIPVIYYFCDSTTGIIDLLYTLIAQLVRVLPDDLQSQLDFSPARFEALDGTPKSIDQAITLFADLLNAGPYTLFIIIDGLQALERPSNRAHIQRLVNVLRSTDDDAVSERTCITKTLLTTDGFTEALIQLKGDERMDSAEFLGEDGAGPDYDGMEVGFL